MTEFMKGFKEGAKRFGVCISTVVNSVLLLIAYILGVGMSAISAKVFGKHFLEKKISKQSYWSELNLKKKQRKEYLRQF